MLEPEPSQRLTVEEADTRLRNLYKRQDKPVYCIRLEADKNQDAPKTIEAPKRKMMLSTLTSKLQPKPISMISSTSTKYNMNSSIKKDENMPYQ